LVKYFAILQAVNNKLKAKFPEIKILAESDVEEKIIRPSFMTMLDNIEHEDFMNVGVDKSVKLRIYYFSKTRDNNKLENLKVLDDLDSIFLEDNVLNIDGFNVSIGRIDVNINESKVLEYSFEIEFSENYERKYDGVENMEEIQIKMIKEE